MRLPGERFSKTWLGCLDEVDTAERPAERWDETVARIAWSMRSMAMRHSRSFPHVVNASISEPPLGPFFARIERLHAEQRVPRESLARIWSVICAFVTGHVLSAISHAQVGCSSGGCEVADKIAAKLQASEDDFRHESRSRSRATPRGSGPRIASPAAVLLRSSVHGSAF